MASYLIPFKTGMSSNLLIAPVFEVEKPHTGLLLCRKGDYTLLELYKLFFQFSVLIFRMIFFGRLHKSVLECDGFAFLRAPEQHQAMVFG